MLTGEINCLCRRLRHGFKVENRGKAWKKMKVAVMSDIHGNLEAADAAKRRLGRIKDIEGIILLGDLIDYGPHSNEVIQLAANLPYPVLCNIWGNHEAAIVKGQYERFSTERGKACACHTYKHLSRTSHDYLVHEMHRGGRYEFDICGRKCLAVHGSLSDEYWKGIRPEDGLEEYGKFDYVFSGHTHLPHYFERYYPVEDAQKRNRKKTIFLNPGSVGQPRNLNAMAQCAVVNMESEEITIVKCPYDISKEQNAFPVEINEFYKHRLEYGI